MEYMSAKDAAEKWGISQRRVAILCSENRIPDASMIGNMWIIPKNALKPSDARTTRYIKQDSKKVKPFLKWAGGKTQLLSDIENFYPFDGKMIRYVEPFVGGGAVLFDILSKYKLQDVYISDINAELINAYLIIRDNVDDLILMLQSMQDIFWPMTTDERKKFYLDKRQKFNDLKLTNISKNSIEKAALMIFLNKTCFNGLFRVNKKGGFNVPMGAYKKPLICDDDNLKNISKLLKNVDIKCCSYENALTFIDNKTFVYIDPPYRPLSTTANFTAYTQDVFDDDAQIKLAEFVDRVNNKGAKVLISNSDPKNINEDDDFFDLLYVKYNIKRVDATRMINSKSTGRGKIKELLIYN